MSFLPGPDFAQQLDNADPLSHFRQQFAIPEKDGKALIYFSGNSLGLMPFKTGSYIQSELEQWAKYGVEGHFRGKNPWVSYHRIVAPELAELCGASENEVVAANSLTVNLHLLMASFYQPSSTRYKIIMEAGAFPSDQYALETQVRWHGFKPEKAIIEIKPRAGETHLRQSDIEAAILEHGPELALVMFAGLNYYTGQVFNMKAIAEAAHNVGALVGFDLAHAIGNVPLSLHNWGADFAVWCTYKYLNSGPGGVGGYFVHNRHANRPNLNRLAGWWGHNETERFKMEKGFKPMEGAEGWQLSNAPVISLAAHKAALSIFKEAGLANIFKKSVALQDYLDFVLSEIDGIKVITPKGESGSQRSIVVLKDGRKVFETLELEGVIADWREPDVIRIAPVPLYNTFSEIWAFGEKLKQIIGIV